MPFLAITMLWLGEHRALIVECIIKTENCMSVQHEFHKKFKLKRYDSVLLRVTISK